MREEVVRRRNALGSHGRSSRHRPSSRRREWDEESSQWPMAYVGGDVVVREDVRVLWDVDEIVSPSCLIKFDAFKGAATSTDAVTWSRDVSMSKDGPLTVPRGPRHKPLALNDSDRPARSAALGVGKSRGIHWAEPYWLSKMYTGLTISHVIKVSRIKRPGIPEFGINWNTARP